MKYPTPSEQQRWAEMGKDCYKFLESEMIFGTKHRVFAQFNRIFVQLDPNSRYSPHSFKFALPNPLPRGCDGQPYNPIIFRESPQITDLLGIDVDGNKVEILCGELRDNLLNNELTFVVAKDFLQTLVSPDVLLRVTWGGKSRGKDLARAKRQGATLFESTADNRGIRGMDYWIVSWNIAKATPADINLFRLNFATECFLEGAQSVVMLPNVQYAHE